MIWPEDCEEPVANHLSSLGGDLAERHPMYEHILIATDGSEPSEAAAKSGLQLAKSLNADVLVVYISRPYKAAITLGGVDVMPSGDAYDKICEDNAVGILGAVEQEAADLGVPCRTKHIVDDHEWKAIIEAAEGEKCDLIHMGSHGRSGITAFILGSQTQKVLTHSKIPVLVCR